MTKTFDGEDTVLKDGQRLRVHIFAQDAWRRELAARVGTFDDEIAADGIAFADHRPGYHLGSSDASRRAYDQMVEDLQTRWKTPAREIEDRDDSCDLMRDQVMGAADAARVKDMAWRDYVARDLGGLEDAGMSATLPADARTEQSARDAITGTAKDATEHVDHFMRAETGPLAVRIRAAFGEVATSVDIANLITEAERAAITSAEVAERARLQALDPALSAADVAAARREMEDAAFQRDRMRAAVQKLGERLVGVKREEEQARRRTAHKAALVERDKLAKELVAVYPAMAEQLADLAGRIAANDAEIERVNRKLPDGAKWLANAELIARQVNSFLDGTADVPRIAKHMRLPAFLYSGHDPYAWPRPR